MADNQTTYIKDENSNNVESFLDMASNFRVCYSKLDKKPRLDDDMVAYHLLEDDEKVFSIYGYYRLNTFYVMNDEACYIINCDNSTLGYFNILFIRNCNS